LLAGIWILAVFRSRGRRKTPAGQVSEAGDPLAGKILEALLPQSARRWPVDPRFLMQEGRNSASRQDLRAFFARFFEGRTWGNKFNVLGVLAQKREHTRPEHRANQDVRVEHEHL
jgi:hypothetical protein